MTIERFVVGSRVVVVAATVAIAVGTIGCGGQKVTPKPLPNTAATVDQGDKAKVQEALEKAGIKGDITAITPQNDHWLVEIQPPIEPAEPGKRPHPTPPASYNIDMNSLAVKSA